MIEKQAVMTVRRWKRHTKENVERESARTESWAELCYWSQAARLEALQVAWRGLSELNDLLTVAWQAKTLRFLTRKPKRYRNAVLVGKWASSIVDQFMAETKPVHLLRHDGEVITVYIDDDSLPSKLEMISLDDHVSASAFEMHIQHLIQEGGLRDNDKLALPYVTALYFRIPFTAKDVVSSEVKPMEENAIE